MVCLQSTKVEIISTTTTTATATAKATTSIRLSIHRKKVNYFHTQRETPLQAERNKSTNKRTQCVAYKLQATHTYKHTRITSKQVRKLLANDNYKQQQQQTYGDLHGNGGVTGVSGVDLELDGQRSWQRCLSDSGSTALNLSVAEKERLAKI